MRRRISPEPEETVEDLFPNESPPSAKSEEKFDESYLLADQVRKSKRINLNVERRFKIQESKVLSRQAQETCFSSIVEADDYWLNRYMKKELLGFVLENIYFRITILFLIVVNAVLIAISTMDDLMDVHGNLIDILDCMILSVFILEAALRMYYHLGLYFYSGWNVLDLIIVIVTIAYYENPYLRSARALRLLRVVRALSGIRTVRALRGLSVVLATMMSSLIDMANIVMLQTVVMLVLGVVGVTLFGELMPSNFSNIVDACYTLFICFTQDGWADIKEEFDALDYFTAGSLYLVCAVSITGFIFSNLVVACVVTNLESATADMKAEDMEVDNLQEAVKESQMHRHAMWTVGREVTEKTPEVPVILTKNMLLHSRNLMKNQGPFERPSLNYVNAERLSKFFTILVALEENRMEYEVIRKDLDRVVLVLQDICSVTKYMGNDEEEKKMNTRAERLFSNQLDLIRESIVNRKMTGDIVTNMEALNELKTIRRNTLIQDNERHNPEAAKLLKRIKGLIQGIGNRPAAPRRQSRRQSHIILPEHGTQPQHGSVFYRRLS